MKASKRSLKEQNIIVAAEKVFSSLGFKNAKMEEIASQAGITKVTLYTYFQSKENLYMAITYKALQLLIDDYYVTIKEYENKNGQEGALALVDTFMSFIANNSLYSDLLLEYFELIRTTSQVEEKVKLTTAINESIYFKKLQDQHNLPFKLTVQEIDRGKKDGSIINKSDSMLLTLQAWMMSVGYAKVFNGSGGDVIFRTDLKEMKTLIMRNFKAYLNSEL